MPVALLFILTASFSMLVNAQVFRSACRRDVLMKMTDRNKKLVNTERDIISKKQVENVRFCVKDCNSESKCLSINFMQNGTTADEKNCHLLNITKANEVTTLAIAEGWVHYEPVTQAGPRCRNIACNAGETCIERCDILSGYECIDINECASVPCLNGGTCANEVNKYTCTCPSGFQGANCETEVRSCSVNSVCLNGGTCKDLSSDPFLTFRCECPFGYGGEHCELTTNLAAGRPTSQSSQFGIFDSSRAVDGNRDTVMDNGYCTHTQEEANAWWSVDLGAEYTIGSVRITNRVVCWERLSNFDIKVGSSLSTSTLCYYYPGTFPSAATETFSCTSEITGRHVFVALRGTNFLQLCEVQVFAISPKYTSCKEIRQATGASANGVYILWDSTKTSKYSAYCHMSDGGWTLVSRFSNADAKNWMSTTGAYWYDTTAVGSTSSPSANSDMISKAFYNVKGTDIKLTRSDSSSHGYLLYSNGCLSTTTFRAKITSYGNFRNNALWGSNKCMGSCTVTGYSGVSGVSGFSQYSCNGEIQSSSNIGFWCHWGSGDASVMMIGGGGSSCARADHGIGITEENTPKFGTLGVMDFGDNSAGSNAYALNLWIR